MNNYQMVLLSAKQGGGKSTLQEELKTQAYRHYSGVFLINFADPIYTLHNFILNKMESSYGIEKTTEKDGVLLQLLGTEWGRKVLGPDVWCQILKNHVEKYASLYPKSNSLFLVGDCRFRNEFDFFPNALRIRLQCSEEVRKERTRSWRENTKHQSEIDLDPYEKDNRFDMTISTDPKSKSYVDVNGAAHLILAQLQKKTWIEKRKFQ